MSVTHLKVYKRHVLKCFSRAYYNNAMGLQQNLHSTISQREMPLLRRTTPQLCRCVPLTLNGRLGTPHSTKGKMYIGLSEGVSKPLTIFVHTKSSQYSFFLHYHCGFGRLTVIFDIISCKDEDSNLLEYDAVQIGKHSSTQRMKRHPLLKAQ